MTQRDNVKTFPNIDELRGFINTLGSNVSEEFVAKYRGPAQKLFFSSADNKDALFHSKNVRDLVNQKIGGKLKELPPGATSVEQGKWTISQPEFVRKKAQKINWSTKIEVPLTAFREEIVVGTAIGTTFQYLEPQFPTGNLPDLINPTVFSTTVKTVPSKGPVFSYADTLRGLGPSSLTNKVEVRKGKASLSVLWSVTVKTNGTLSNPTIDDIVLSGSNWE